MRTIDQTYKRTANRIKSGYLNSSTLLARVATTFRQLLPPTDVTAASLAVTGLSLRAERRNRQHPLDSGAFAPFGIRSRLVLVLFIFRAWDKQCAVRALHTSDDWGYQAGAEIYLAKDTITIAC
jgi:hypothetical protein